MRSSKFYKLTLSYSQLSIIYDFCMDNYIKSNRILEANPEDYESNVQCELLSPILTQIESIFKVFEV